MFSGTTPASLKKKKERSEGRKEGRREWERNTCFNNFTSVRLKPAYVIQRIKVTFGFKETCLKLSLGSLMHGI